ncbi:hypothetical protein GCM10023232_24220 [Sphingosinicella ginsenosidimutans]|uniref:Tetratricopeptide repeat protein n=1 Tax=Allosphingosinicella ginsenosidimutans TaxID=1176539 RepID=A0A5C6TVB1_9SPHN|nr:hypothetical protein [Sphingosinicella ginsenosidimutans]TXC63638.1 hypothetical protein FRZ32_08180 [Sphingosinicella ginsenosidimutans]
MRLPLPIAGLMLALASPVMGQDQPAAPAPTPDQTVPTVDAPPPGAAAPAAPAAPDPAALDAARRAIATADTQRLVRDADYARAILGDLDLAGPSLPTDADAVAAVRTLRLLALTGAQRRDEAREMADQLLDSRPRDPQLYGAPLVAAAAMEDKALIVRTIEAASRNVSGTGWGTLRGMIDRGAMAGLLGQLKSDHEEALRARLAAALFRIGWPGDGDADMTDTLRTILLDDRLANDDRPAAADYAASIVTPAATLSLIVGKRYDDLLAPGTDRMAMLQRALELQDRETAGALASAPADPRRILDRVRYLRGLGRDADALALLQPFIRDVRATVAGSEEGMWLINEAAYAMVALGRQGDALALMRRLAGLSLDDNAALLGPAINYSLMLWEAGRYGDALDQASRLDRDSERRASAFGQTWIASSIACALAGLGRPAEAAPQVEQLAARPDLNPTALMRTYLCLGRDDDAAALLVSQLQGNDPQAMILALQDYQLARGSAQTGPIYDRLAALRDRPEVQAALARVGRVLSLPLSRTYWSDF